MTPDEIDKLGGRELDAQVAERVFGWPPSAPEAVLHYSTDPAAMMEVVERMRELGWLPHMLATTDGWVVNARRYDVPASGNWGDAMLTGDLVQQTGDTLPLAVARAALKAVEGSL